MLFIQADADMRCPMVHGAALYERLKARGVPTRLIVFRGENHALNRMAKPVKRIRRWAEIARWFAQYL